MALIKCKDCGREISEKAIACPQCGSPQAGAYQPVPGILGLLTNPRLPRMANWICVLCLAVSPAFEILTLPWAFSGTQHVGTSSHAASLALVWDMLTFIIGVAVTVVLFVAGLKLKQLRASARRWITGALYGSIGYEVFALVGSELVEEVIDHAATDPTIGEIVALIGVGLPLFIFQIVAVVWLHRHGHELPLDTQEHQ